MRDLSNPALAAIYSQETSAVFLELLTIDHPDLSQPIRLCTDVIDHVSRGNTYTAFPCQVVLPPDQDGELPTVDLVVENVTRALVDGLRSISTPATITIETVLASSPDVVEVGPLTCACRASQWSRDTVRLSLSFQPIAAEPFPAGVYSPSLFPGLFRAVRVNK